MIVQVLFFIGILKTPFKKEVNTNQTITDMNKNLITDLGENYQYLQTIVNNKLELKKIELAENASSILSKTILLLAVSAISFFAIIILIILVGILIYNMVGSIIMTLCVLLLVALIFILIIYLSRKSIIYKPITKIIYTKILKITD